MMQAREFCNYCGRNVRDLNMIIPSPTGDCIICDQCVKLCAEIINRNVKKEDKLEKVNIMTPSEIKDKLDQYVIGQEEAKRVLSVGVYNHYKRINYNIDVKEKGLSEAIDLDKSNILMIGPTGSGKTLLAKTLAKILNVPFASSDATTLTEAGYVGDDVETILLKLIENANYDIAKAERGIVYIDEIDKIAAKYQNRSITRDVSGEGVQQALLKILESTVATVQPQGGRRQPNTPGYSIDTTNILFICGGAFIGLDKIIAERGDHNMGFGGKLLEVKGDKEQKIDYIGAITPDDLIKYGMLPEFVGRLPIVIGLNELSREDLVRILTDTKNNIINQYKTMFELDGVELVFEKEAIEAVADKAIELKTGARGLRSILEKIMLELMFSVPNNRELTSITIGADVISGTGKPIYTYKVKQDTLKSA